MTKTVEMEEWRREALQMCKDCEDRESRLNEWETNFIASTRDHLESGGDLTPNWKDKLADVWEAATERG